MPLVEDPRLNTPDVENDGQKYPAALIRKEMGLLSTPVVRADLDMLEVRKITIVVRRS